MSLFKPPSEKVLGAELQRLVRFYYDMFNERIPEARVIPEVEFNVVARIALEEANLLEICTEDGTFRLRSGVELGPGYLLPPKGMELLAELVRARVRAINSGDSTLFLITDRELRCLTKDAPLLEKNPKKELLGMQREIARTKPHIGAVPFETFAKEMIRIMSMNGDVKQVAKGGRQVWRMTRAFKRRTSWS